eukprot:TRINITY_DN3391_c0_g1_i1.p1 TRINITY_DN3391_c0_g1~~TRINITY_DN3391_c0_g1_i1.p1  ORF type:complete len:257 (+),score=58.44 TRINITY_DN3391_c0_g1_i1:847-1617(+)
MSGEDATWRVSGLPDGVLHAIFGRLGFADLTACAGTCDTWKVAIYEDEPLLSVLPVQRRQFRAPQGMAACHCHALPSRHRSTIPAASSSSSSLPRALLDESKPKEGSRLRHPHPPLPTLLLRCAEVGNMAAMTLVADEMERRGDLDGALGWFRKAARKGHQGSQYRVGAAYYRGEGRAGRDGEEALAWLLRAVKHPQGDESITAAAALLLGYMYLDGEGTQRIDHGEAVKWFKAAGALGCREAEKTIGWLWNTGQY